MAKKMKQTVFMKENKKNIHPNSRKAKQLSKKITREIRMQKKKHHGQMRLQLLGRKLAWFRENIDFSLQCYTPVQFKKLIIKYINRHDEELKLIKMKHNIRRKAKKRQHASREDFLAASKKNELGEFNGIGIEVVNLLCSDNYRNFKCWTGELRFISNLKTKPISRKMLEGFQRAYIKSIKGKVSESNVSLTLDNPNMSNSNLNNPSTLLNNANKLSKLYNETQEGTNKKVLAIIKSSISTMQLQSHPADCIASEVLLNTAETSLSTEAMMDYSKMDGIEEIDEEIKNKILDDHVRSDDIDDDDDAFEKEYLNDFDDVANNSSEELLNYVT